VHPMSHHKGGESKKASMQTSKLTNWSVS
jgi:hypothetical protein